LPFLGPVITVAAGARQPTAATRLAIQATPFGVAQEAALAARLPRIAAQ
jgi:hypothetical protein